VKKIIILAVVLLTGAVHAKSWVETIKLGGDYRYRHDYIERKGMDRRSRHQMRLRLNIEGRVNDYIKIGTQIATGFDNPTASNQTFTDGFSSKAVAFNRAYFEAHHNCLPGLLVYGGKVPDPWFRPGGFELVWDDDLNPEGLCATFTGGGSRLQARLAGSFFWIEERTNQIESYLRGAQAVATYTPCCIRADFSVGASYYTYINIKGFPTFYDPARSFGNSINADSGYLWDFELAEIMAQMNLTAGQVPIQLAGDVIINTTADSLNTGWLAGVTVGRTKNPGNIQVKYTYRRVEKDATIGVFTDNVFAGGGTDVEGHEVNLEIQIAENTGLKVNYFNTHLYLANKIKYQRLQFDLNFKF
jgi:hypothetical protein